MLRHPVFHEKLHFVSPYYLKLTICLVLGFLGLMLKWLTNWSLSYKSSLLLGVFLFVIFWVYTVSSSTCLPRHNLRARHGSPPRFAPSSSHSNYGLWVAMLFPPAVLAVYSFFIGCKLDRSPDIASWVGLFVPLWVLMIFVSILGILYACACWKAGYVMPIPWIFAAVVACWVFIVLYPLMLDGVVEGSVIVAYVPLFVASGCEVVHAVITKIKPLDI